MSVEKKEIQKIISQVDSILEYSENLKLTLSSQIKLIHPKFIKSANNLIDYMALRHFDIRQMQDQLSSLGLSSVGRSEGHVLDNLGSVTSLLYKILGQEEKKTKRHYKNVTREQSKQILNRNVQSLLGASPKERSVRIMVSVSKETAADYKILSEMLEGGMNCVRINCAYDDKKIWKKIIANINKAKKETGKSCKILMDLAGPKLRTGKLKSGPEIIHIQPGKDIKGKVVRAASIFLAPVGTTLPSVADYLLPVSKAALKKLKNHDRIYFRDISDKKKQMKIISKKTHGFIAELSKSAYIQTGTKLKKKGRGKKIKFSVGELPALEISISLKIGDYLILHKPGIEGEPAVYDSKNKLVKQPHISCTFPEVFENIKAGERILFDDGKIEGIIDSTSKEELKIKITYAKDKGSKLRADKSINFPDSNLKINGLTEKDRKDLEFIVEYADIVNMSFVNKPKDVHLLQNELKRLKAEHIGIMLKIETKRGFKNLPSLLLSVMQNYPAGIMIARGDLAVEAGWIRLAEVQEEILWLCEAAHIPVVWATQVLENLAKKGSPSRAEITDAAMAQRSDCVMLNKGPHIIETIRMLQNIITSMQDHQYKKTSMLRRLKIQIV